MLKKCFSTRKRASVASAVITMLVCAGTAVAAWVIYSGINGSAGGSFSSTTTSATALTYATGTPAATALTPGSSTTVNVKLTNNDPSISHTVTTLTSAFTSSPVDCAAHLTTGTVTGIGGGTVVPAGGSVTGTVIVNADASLPNDCVGGTYTLTFSGTSTP
jgi:hypothetical protein